MGEPTLRVYLAGSIRLERGEVLLPESRLPGRQGRVAIAMLAAEHGRAITTDELAEELWGGAPPAAWEVALRAIVSKLRAALHEVGIDRHEAVAHAFGCYQLHLPTDAWVDVEAAVDAIHRAETAIREGDLSDAMGWALAANAIARRGFLPGEDGRWASRRRAELGTIRVRSLECRAQVQLRRGEHQAAVRDAELVVALEPFRETAHRLLMRAHAAAGNHAEALRAFERCRRTIAEELGAGPSAETESLYLEILRSA
ncbi:MAG: AfsR/SARP family transcriptional regulator [Actinomycetota bacterium]